MFKTDYTPSAAPISTARLSPVSQRLIDARTLERKASDLFGQARRESATGNAEASVHSNAGALALVDQADALRHEAQKANRRTAGWFHADYCGSAMTVTNVDVRHAHGDVNVRLIVFIDCDPADFDVPELSKALHALVGAINADPTSADWTHAEDLTLVDFVSSELPDGFCLSVSATGDEPTPWDDTVSESWLVLNYAK